MKNKGLSIRRNYKNSNEVKIFFYCYAKVFMLQIKITNLLNYVTTILAIYILTLFVLERFWTINVENVINESQIFCNV